MDNDDMLMCRLIANPYVINRDNNNKIKFIDKEMYNLLCKKYPDFIIYYDDLNLIYEVLNKKIEEIHRINLINELIENTINGAIDRAIKP